MTPDHSLHDKRSSTRIRTYLGARVSFLSQIGAISCLVRDLSEGGAQLVVTGAEALPSEIELDIPRVKIATRARVMWRDGDVCGVQFLDNGGTAHQARASDPHPEATLDNLPPSAIGAALSEPRLGAAQPGHLA
jgi:PilZ domain